MEGLGFRDDLQYGNRDLQYHLAVLLPERKPFESILNLDSEVSEHLKWDEAEGFYVVPVLLRPKSVGKIRLRSSNPFEYPVLQPNYLTETEDVMVMLRGIRIFQKLLKTKAFKDIGARLDTTLMPTCIQYIYDSDEYWQCYVRSLSITVYHPTGTCKMGPLKDPSTVVDPQLRVKGISGLRVADASIMPNIVSGNTNAPCIMIGEMAADINGFYHLCGDECADARGGLRYTSMNSSANDRHLVDTRQVLTDISSTTSSASATTTTTFC